MRIPEFVRPIRDQYESEADYIYACGAAVREYNNRMMHAIDASSGAGMFTRMPDVKAKISMHEYLSDRPELLKRYKEIGPAALLEF